MSTSANADPAEDGVEREVTRSDSPNRVHKDQALSDLEQRRVGMYSKHGSMLQLLEEHAQSKPKAHRA